MSAHPGRLHSSCVPLLLDAPANVKRFAGANFTAGGREALVQVRLAPSRSKEADDSVLLNGAHGTRDIEGKAAREAASELGSERVSMERVGTRDVEHVVEFRRGKRRTFRRDRFREP